MKWQPIESAPKDGRLLVVGAWYEPEGFWVYRAIARREPYSDAYIEEGSRRSKITTATHYLEIPDEIETKS